MKKETKRTPAPRRISVYIPRTLIEQLREEGRRQDRTVSWLLQRAWILARKQIISTPDLQEPK